MKKNLLKILGSVLLLVLAVVTGGVSMMAAPPVIPDAGSDEADPNENTPLEGAHKDQPGMGIEQPGHASTGSGVEQAELDDDHIYDYIMRYEAWKNPLHTDFMRLAKRVKVDTKHPQHPVLGEAILECDIKNLVIDEEDATVGTLSVNTMDSKMFIPSSTVRVFGKYGTDGRQLILYVESNKDGVIKVRQVNGATANGWKNIPEADYTANHVRVQATALSESEVEVKPDNFLPQWRQAYLQKKGCAITKTAFYERMKKEVAFGGQMAKDAVLATFRKKCTSTLLTGVPGVMQKYNEKTGWEYAYFQEGIVSQLPNTYEFSGIPTVEDLVAITRLCFTKYAKNNIAQCYCGSLFMQWLECMDFSSHPEMTIATKRDDLQIVVKSITTNFGTLEFKLEYGMDEEGMAGNAIIANMNDAIHYEYENTTISVDHSKGEGGEVRQASSEYYIQDDCLMLTGLNGMFVGVDVAAAGEKTGENQKKIVSKSTLPASGTAGVIYYLIADTESHKIGTYIYEGGAWKAYSL